MSVQPHNPDIMGLSNDPGVVSCHGKECYGSKAKALEARVDRIRRAKHPRHPHKAKKRDATRLQAYRCQHCHQWHLGSPNDGKAMT